MRVFLTTVFALFSIYSLRAQTFLYLDKTNPEEIRPATTAYIDTLDEGIRMHLIRHSEEKEIDEIIVVDSLYNTKKWIYRNPNINTDLSAVRSDEKIVVRGIRRGEQIEEEFHIGHDTWNQAFPYDMAGFIRSGKSKRIFRAIGAARPGEIKIGKFKAVKKDKTVLGLDCGDQAAVRVEMSLTGALSMFWKGSYWFRPSDGRYLRFEGKIGGPGSERRITEFAGEGKKVEQGGADRL